MRYFGRPLSSFSPLILFCFFIYFLTGGVSFCQYFLSQIGPSVFSKKLVHYRHSCYVLSRLPCSKNSLLLTVNLTRIGRIETLRATTGDTRIWSFFISFDELYCKFFIPHFLRHLILFIRPLLRAIESYKALQIFPTFYCLKQKQVSFSGFVRGRSIASY